MVPREERSTEPAPNRRRRDGDASSVPESLAGRDGFEPPNLAFEESRKLHVPLGFENVAASGQLIPSAD